MPCSRKPVPPISITALMEQNAASAFAQTLPLKIAIAGTDVIHKRQIPRSEQELYSRNAGVPKNASLSTLGSEKILMGASHWRVIDGNEAGYLEQPGYMYCLFDLRNGDVLTVVRKDKREIDFTATQVEEIGNELTVLKRFMMSNINGS